MFLADYKILIEPSAIKELNKLPKKDLQKITVKIQSHAKNPHPVECEKLVAQNAYRIRYGVNRIIYTIEDENLIIIVIKIGHRREVYR
jgi:mRNA interferase RelE/StbE